MSEHLIRLRGGWLRHVPETAVARLERVQLPMGWPSGPGLRVRLSRSFGAPPIDRAREQLLIRLDAVPGLVAAWLNDREIARPPAGTSALEVVLEERLPARNQLVLEVDPEIAAESPPVAPGWGSLALVIRLRGDPEDRPANR